MSKLIEHHPPRAQRGQAQVMRIPKKGSKCRCATDESVQILMSLQVCFWEPFVYGLWGTLVQQCPFGGRGVLSA